MLRGRRGPFWLRGWGRLQEASFQPSPEAYTGVDTVAVRQECLWRGACCLRGGLEMGAGECRSARPSLGGGRLPLSATPPKVLSLPLVASAYLQTEPPVSLGLCKANRLCVQKILDEGSLNTTVKGLSEKGHLFRPWETRLSIWAGFLRSPGWPLQRGKSTNMQGPWRPRRGREGSWRVHARSRELTSWAHPSQASFWVSWGNFAQLNESSKQSRRAE